MISGGLLPQRVTIERNTPTVRPTGVEEKVLAVIATGVEASIQPNKDADIPRIQGQQRLASFLAFFRIGTDVQRTDRITDEGSGETYQVTDLFDAAGRAHHFEAELMLDRRV